MSIFPIFMAMGGGSIMRAAAKVAGIGVVNTGLRGGVIPESPISAAARTVSRPVGAIATNSSSDSVRTSVTIDTPDVEKPRWGVIDDWEFAGGDEEILAVTGDPLPRLVFGGPPTIDEAKKATDELKDALEKVFVSSPKSDGYDEGLHGSGGYSSCLLQLSSTDVIENKACLTSATSTTKHAIQAFRLLDQSPEVQGVVASIASDPNVWEAVLGNRELQSYLQSHIATNSSVHQNVRESLVQGDIRYQENPMSIEVFSESGKSDGNVESETGKSEDGESNSKNEFLDIWKNIKLAVVDMMSSLSDYFNSLFGAQGDNKGTENSNPDPAGAVVEKFLGPALVGVVVMVIMVVLMKRV